ncbi:single-strand DNA-binding protein [Bifidobacterium bohemicum]|uniref:Single-strand binding family protein n=1 Tax=Bifidobacterium bohemicum DSM 22767 TaxID=1437606 RepID=A0A086ZK72_9BIFI|nr:single-stranded DNA-binding protein [Bifidobacterium bohemicum]KFI46922.1 single-strand binding family protein [Bifidobacterium bohemicum DSM 22767]SCB85087.1 single-strand DNA-binding protein [Bifidobacterium bohemicum]
MAQQSTVTINGFVGADPVSFGREGDSAACSFRIGCTPRYYNSSTGQWCDRSTTWLTVKAYRALALNVMRSIHKGDPVVATGALYGEEWSKDGVKHVKMVMEATGIGHDLSLGVSHFKRTKANGSTFDPRQSRQAPGSDPYHDASNGAASYTDVAGAAYPNHAPRTNDDAWRSSANADSSVDQVSPDEFGAQPDEVH